MCIHLRYPHVGNIQGRRDDRQGEAYHQRTSNSTLSPSRTCTILFQHRSVLLTAWRQAYSMAYPPLILRCSRQSKCFWGLFPFFLSVPRVHASTQHHTSPPNRATSLLPVRSSTLPTTLRPVCLPASFSSSAFPPISFPSTLCVCVSQTSHGLRNSSHVSQSSHKRATTTVNNVVSKRSCSMAEYTRILPAPPRKMLRQDTTTHITKPPYQARTLHACGPWGKHRRGWIVHTDAHSQRRIYWSNKKNRRSRAPTTTKQRTYYSPTDRIIFFFPDGRLCSEYCKDNQRPCLPARSETAKKMSCRWRTANNPGETALLPRRQTVKHNESDRHACPETNAFNETNTTKGHRNNTAR